MRDLLRAVLRNIAGGLLAMGVICGYLGTLPSLLFAAGGMALMLAPLLAPVRAVGSAVDAVLLRIPGLKWWAWYALMEGKRV